MGKEWDKLNAEKRGNAALMPNSDRNYKHDGRDNVGGRLSRTAAPPTPKKNPRCRRCGRLKIDKEPSRCRCEQPDWDTRTREFGWQMQAWHQAWATEALRVLKPGGHLLAFGGTRTYHRLACALEDAGFEIRDCLAWLYGSGFPKSLDVSKAIDKANGKHQRDLVPFGAFIRTAREAKGWSLRELDEAMGTNTAASWWEGRKSGVQPPGVAMYERLKAVLGLDDRYDELVAWAEAEREAIGQRDVPRGHAFAGPTYGGDSSSKTVAVTLPALDDAEKWQGWGTALKPAFEPIVLARKPLIGSVAQNVLTYGTGGLNIDGTRIEAKPRTTHADGNHQGTAPQPMSWGEPTAYAVEGASSRWPPNVLLGHSPDCKPTGKTRKVRTGTASPESGGFGGSMFGDGSPDRIGGSHADAEGFETVEVWDCVPDCPVAMLDEQSGERPAGSPKTGREPKAAAFSGNLYGEAAANGASFAGYQDFGGASRFFYIAKADREERNRGLEHHAEKSVHPPSGDGRVWDIPGSKSMHRANNHPTVKPVELMQWLVRLITPPKGLVLDPFAGSGSTLIAACREGFDCIGIEREPEYVAIARDRIIGDGPLFNIEWERESDG